MKNYLVLILIMHLEIDMLPMVDRNFGGRRVQIVGGYKRLDELSEKLKPFSDRVLKEDCLDLPEKTYVERQVELTDEQKKTYATMKSAALAQLKGKMATAPHVLTQLMRLHQITCGHLKMMMTQLQK